MKFGEGNLSGYGELDWKMGVYMITFHYIYMHEILKNKEFF